MASLGEILSARGDAAIAGGGGTSGVVLPQSNQALAYLMNLANTQAQANQYLLRQHNERLNDRLTNFDRINLEGLMSSDYAPLAAEYASLSRDLASNYDVIANPMRNQAKAQELRAREASLRARIAQSQQDRLVNEENRRFVQAHPEFNTPEFEQQYQSFLSTPLGQRTPYNVSAPFVYDPTTRAKAAADFAKQEYSKVQKSKDGRYQTEESGTKYLRDKYLEAWNAIGTQTDKYGRQIQQSTVNAWNKLTPDQKAAYDNDIEKWDRETAIVLSPLDQIKSQKVSEDQFATISAQGAESRRTEAMRESFQAKQNELDRAVQWANVDARMNEIGKGKINKKEAGVFKNALLYQAFTGSNQPLTGSALTENIPNNVLQPIYGDNTKIKVEDELGQKKVEAPRIQVIGNYVDSEGNLIISLRDNLTGRQVNKKRVSFKKAYSDFNYVRGNDNASVMSESSREFLKNNGLSTQPTLDELRKYFDSEATGGQASASPKVTTTKKSATDYGL
jgi:hypothetical protein